jgi:Flp pilus assembly protein TadG
MRRLGLSPHDKPRARAGQSVVEFALVSLTILLIVFGIVDIGRGVFQRSMLTNATREAARYASVNSQWANNVAAIADYAAQRSPTLALTSANVTVTCYKWNSSASPPGWDTYTNCVPSSGQSALDIGDRLQVDVTYTFKTTAGLLLPLPPIQMSESAVTTIQ